MTSIPVVNGKATFYPSIHSADKEPKDATVTKVWSPTCVNLEYPMETGGAMAVVTSVHVVAAREHSEHGYCCVLLPIPQEAEPTTFAAHPLHAANAAFNAG